MKQSFYILLLLVLVNIISCNHQDIPEPEKELPTPEKPIPPEEPIDSNAVECALWDGILRLYIIDKDSNGIVDLNYPKTHILEKGKIYIKQAYYAESYPFWVDSIDIQAPPIPNDYLSLILGFGTQHDRFFTETKDSIHIPNHSVPILEYYTKIGVEWTNGDIDTFKIRLTSACSFTIKETYYKDSLISNYGFAYLIKEVQ